MKYFLIAGEASGDLHASNLMKGLKQHDSRAEFRFMGGDLMQAVSGEMISHYRETSYMMLDVLLHLGKIFRTLRKVKEEIRSWKPDVVIPVDFPGFNLRLARFAFSLGFKVYYFISPKVWAWNQRRIRHLKRFTNHLFVILPFEVAYFSRFGMKVEYFGNPLVDGIYEFRKRFKGVERWKGEHGFDHKPIVALLAGSRRKEIGSMLPPMIRVVQEHPECRFVVAGAPSIEPSFYERYLKGSNVDIVYQETYELLESAMAGLVTSGTATLEAALFGLPQVVLYKTGSLAYALGKRLIKINFISLVNLIYGSELVVEVIQKDLYGRAAGELSRILENRAHRDWMKQGYKEIQAELGENGVALRIGNRMVELLKSESE